ncbi:kinase-like protein [Setomelanomma holmii]|uniref:Kinase-like protein n=1 Tax=Setomelanomma holmii TaxID=210430 RepID=A0A9P4HC12_9PLEO|nr:kinase-like protein [Setomelanomma holmii]
MAHYIGPGINSDHVSMIIKPDTDEIHRVDSGHEVAHDQDAYGQDPDLLHRSDYKDLGHLLRKCGIKYFDTRRSIKCFWPAPVLQRIMTRERVVDELQSYKDTEPGIFHTTALRTLADTILHHHRKVFAVLVLISKGRSIQAVIDAHVKDAQLPLETSGTDCHLYTTLQGSSQLARIDCFEQPGWDIVHRENFSEWQYAVDPCILKLEKDGRTPKHEDFHDKIVLPFTHEAERHKGGYGVITKVTVHDGCHDFHALLRSIKAENSFAKKQLINDDAKEFEGEAEALRRFNGFGNDHMVTLLMTWTLHRSYNLLFPWAKCDLDYYWESNPLPIMEAETILWTSKQITGIASAIRSIHNPISKNLRVEDDDKYGRHGDLKAENILLFDSPDDPKGILVVADLGLAKLNSIVSRSAQSNHRIHCTPKYKPPESDIEGAKITRSYDIWTFGCLLLEWMCWLFQGHSNKAIFNWHLGSPYPSGSIAETFFEMKAQGNGRYHVVVKPKVLEKMAELHADEKCTQYFHELLYLVEEHMLITRAIYRMDSETLHKKLDGMYERAQNDRSYYYDSCKGSRQIREQDPLDAEFKKMQPRAGQPMLKA